MDDVEDNEDPVEPTPEQDEREDGRVSPDEQAVNEDSEDINYLPLSDDEVSLGNEDFIVPEEPLELERFNRRLIAIARSLKKKQQQLQADQDLLNDRWTNVLAAEEYCLECPTKSYPKRKLLPQFDDEAPKPEHQIAPSNHKGRDKTARDIHMTFGRTWTVEQDKPDRSTDRGGAPRHAKTTI